MYKQLVLVRKDLGMSIGKLAAQVSHASMAFLTNMIRKNTTGIINEKIGRAYKYEDIPQYYRHPDLDSFAEITRNNGKRLFYYKPMNLDNPYGRQIMCDACTIKEYHTDFIINKDLYEQWINGEFTKIVCEAKNKNHLLKAKKIAEEMEMIEGKDFFLIKDNCHTELEPEEFDENGVGRTLTCIGFKPMDSEIINKIGRKFQLYK